MKKSGFIIGSIEIILGLLSLLVTSAIKEIMPKVARMCFMFNTGGFSEGDYTPNFGAANAIAISFCLIGIATILYFSIKKEQ